MIAILRCFAEISSLKINHFGSALFEISVDTAPLHLADIVGFA